MARGHAGSMTIKSNELGGVALPCLAVPCLLLLQVYWRIEGILRQMRFIVQAKWKLNI